MSAVVIQDLIFIALLIALSIPLGIYISMVMEGKKVFLTPLLGPVERGVYRLMGVRADENMSSKKYSISLLGFSFLSLLAVWLIQMLQGYLPFNPAKLTSTSWHLAFNTAASFVSNTNWQAYSGENTLSYLTQLLGLTVQNFVSAAAGIAVMFALIRGLVAKNTGNSGSFWVDLTRSTLYILLPLSFLVAIFLVSQGVVQSFLPYGSAQTLQDNSFQTIPLGPAASQIAIKQLGTNGGGFFGANSSHPFENPGVFSNLIEMLSILLIPSALCVSFGLSVKDFKQGRTIYAAMLILFVLAVAGLSLSEFHLGPSFTGVASSGSLEGKESVHGVGASALWAAVTTSASNGSVNAMHDSLTPLGGFVTMFLMQLGEIVFGGAGSGLYGMLAFVLLTVFIAGLMVGRTPEYLNKKIAPFDMRMVCLIILTPLLVTLLGTAAAVLVPGIDKNLNNSGAHGFSEILYAFSSMGNNNGSAFAGFNANTVFTNLTGGVIMLLSRFIPMVAAVNLGDSFANKRLVAQSEGTLSTTSPLFIGLLLGVILIVGALSFLPALALGPIADFFTSL